MLGFYYVSIIQISFRDGVKVPGEINDYIVFVI